jgi:hypothetical protein
VQEKEEFSSESKKLKKVLKVLIKKKVTEAPVLALQIFEVVFEGNYNVIGRVN